MIETAWRKMRRWGKAEREQREEMGGSKVVMALVFPLAVTR